MARPIDWEAIFRRRPELESPGFQETAAAIRQERLGRLAKTEAEVREKLEKARNLGTAC
jgi:hypothetical protein